MYHRIEVNAEAARSIGVCADGNGRASVDRDHVIANVHDVIASGRVLADPGAVAALLEITTDEAAAILVDVGALDDALAEDAR